MPSDIAAATIISGRRAILTPSIAACSMRLGSFTTNEPPTATCERRPFGSNSHGWIATGIDAGWRMVQPFLDAWRGATATLLNQLIQGNRSSGCPKPQPLVDGREPIERKIFVRRRRPILQPIRAHVFSRREAGRGRAHMSRSRAPGDNGRHPGRLAADHTSAPSIHVRST